MNYCADNEELDHYRHASRRAAITSLIGAMLAGGAMVYAVWRVYELQRQVECLQDDICIKRKEVESLSVEALSLRFNLQESLNGLRHHYSGEYTEAEKSYDSVLNVASNDYVVLTLKANTLYKMARYRESENLARQAMVINPNYLPPRYTLVLVLFKMQRIAEATRVLEALLAKDPCSYYRILCDDNFNEFKHIAGFRSATARHLDTIRSIQEGLARLGYYKGSVDGLIGAQTDAAIQRFCRDARMSVGAVTTEQLIKAIRKQLGTGKSEGS